MYDGEFSTDNQNVCAHKEKRVTSKVRKKNGVD